MFYLRESEAAATMFYLCESEATATMFYLCESEVTATKRPVGAEINLSFLPKSHTKLFTFRQHSKGTIQVVPFFISPYFEKSTFHISNFVYNS
ncbi:hypothetical protein [Bacillus sp. RS11]|uniref:hypothetical protein n=1 Tax=Lysinibacillus sp. RS11 TaxID=3242682 RepID=UPI0035C73932